MRSFVNQNNSEDKLNEIVRKCNFLKQSLETTLENENLLDTTIRALNTEKVDFIESIIEEINLIKVSVLDQAPS